MLNYCERHGIDNDGSFKTLSRTAAIFSTIRIVFSLPGGLTLSRASTFKFLN